MNMGELNQLANHGVELPVIAFQLVHPAAKLPEYAHPGDAGADVCAALDKSIVLHPGEWRLIPTGLRADIPTGYEIQVRPRSGLAMKYGITVLNSPGTVDSSFKGTIGVILINHNIYTYQSFTVNPGDKIAQFVIARHAVGRFKEVDAVGESSRGEDGFGSTGVGS